MPTMGEARLMNQPGRKGVRRRKTLKVYTKSASSAVRSRSFTSLSGARYSSTGRAIARGVPMICANPDFVSPPKPGKATTYQPGTLAAHYEALGGKCVYYGKPHKEHFDACVAGLGLPKERVAHVGDSMHHDVVGATAAGVPVVFVVGGIEHEKLGIAPGELPSAAALASLCEEFGATPTHTVALARW